MCAFDIWENILLINDLFFAGERFEETYEEAQCPQALDAWQIGRSICM